MLPDIGQGTITEFSTTGLTCQIPHEQYQQLRPEDRWMAHETLPAVSWFTRERVRLERLVYMPVPPVPGTNEDKVDYFFRAETPTQERDLLGMEGELDDDMDYADSDNNESYESYDIDDGASSSAEDDLKDLVDELEALRADLRTPAVAIPETVIIITSSDSYENGNVKFRASLADVPAPKTLSAAVATKVAVSSMPASLLSCANLE